MENYKMGKYNPNIHHRRSIRLKGYDYSQAGLYFITICCQNRKHLFGEIINGQMELNNAGKMIEKIWYEIPNDFPNINLHEYITMPNHIHGIIEIVGADSISAPIPVNPISDQSTVDSISVHPTVDSISINPIVDSISAPITDQITDQITGQKGQKRMAEMDSAPTGTGTGVGLSQVIQSFKRHTTIEYIKMVKQNILPSFDKRIWQRNYWEHIIRNENAFVRISEYIMNNSMNWKKDKLNGGEGNLVMESSTPYRKLDGINYERS